MRAYLFTVLMLAQILPSTGQVDSLLVISLFDTANKELYNNQFDSIQSRVDLIYEIYRNKNYPTDITLLRTLLLESTLLEKQGQNKDALRIVGKAENEYGNLRQSNNGMRSMIYHKMAVNEIRVGAYSDALQSATLAYEYATDREHTRDVTTINALLAISSAHYKLYDHQKSLDVQKKVLEMQEDIYGPDSEKIAVGLNNLGNRYHDLRQYDKALDNIYRAKDIQTKAFGPDNFYLAFSHYNIAINLEGKGLFMEAIEQYLESARITEIHTPGHVYIAEDYRKIGRCYQSLGNIGEAMANYQQALKLFEKHPKQHIVPKADLFADLASLYSEEDQLEKALSYLDLSLETARPLLGDFHPKIAEYVGRKSQYSTDNGKPEMGKDFANQSLLALGYDEISFSPELASAQNHLYGQLANAARAHLKSYHFTKDRMELDTALQFYQRAGQMLDLLYRRLQNESSKHLLRSQTIRLYEHWIETLYFLFLETAEIKYAEMALQVSELSRRSTVLASILSRLTAEKKQVPHRIFEREQFLQNNLIKLGEQLSKLTTDGNDLVQDRIRMEDSLFLQKKNYYSFLDSLKNNYPTYYERRFADDPIDITSVRSNLGVDECVLEYFDGEDFIFAFALRCDQLRFERVQKTDQLMDGLSSFQAHLSNPDTVLTDPERSMRAFSIASHGLYNLLLDPLLSAKDKNILVVPDGIESKLVFDVFLTVPATTNDPKTWSYLYNTSTIHYAQSIAAWNEQKKHQAEPKHDFIGFAPTYNTAELAAADTLDQKTYALVVRSGAFQLLGAQEEVREIGEIISGELCIGQDASEKNFMAKAGDYRIIHLSAHAILDDHLPNKSKFLLSANNDSVYDSELTAAEICYMDLSADLVVLSACHTGSGKINRGEGVMSLGRAFAFAGIPSTLQSLWKVPDEATARVMPSFYRELRQGLRKHEALNNARKAYLSQTQIAEQRHPYYWAGFILYGQVDPLHFQSTKFNSVFIFICLIFLFLGYNIWRQIRS